MSHHKKTVKREASVELRLPVEYKGGERSDSLSPSAYLLAYGAPLRDVGSRTKKILCPLRPVVNVNVSDEVRVASRCFLTGTGDEGIRVAQIGGQSRNNVCERIEVHYADGTTYGARKLEIRN